MLKVNKRAEEMRLAALARKKERLHGHNRQVEERCSRKITDTRTKTEGLKNALRMKQTLAQQRRNAILEEVKAVAKVKKVTKPAQN